MCFLTVFICVLNTMGVFYAVGLYFVCVTLWLLIVFVLCWYHFHFIFEPRHSYITEKKKHNFILERHCTLLKKTRKFIIETVCFFYERDK